MKWLGAGDEEGALSKDGPPMTPWGYVVTEMPFMHWHLRALPGKGLSERVFI